MKHIHTVFWNIYTYLPSKYLWDLHDLIVHHSSGFHNTRQVAHTFSKHSSWNASQRSYIAHNWNTSVTSQTRRTYSLPKFTKIQSSWTFPLINRNHRCSYTQSQSPELTLVTWFHLQCRRVTILIIDTYSGSTFSLEGFQRFQSPIGRNWYLIQTHTIH